MWRRSRGIVPGLLLASALLGLSAPASASEPSGWLELNAGPAGSVHRLTPGGSAHWPVDVVVRGEPATALDVELQPEPGAPDVLRGFLTVELRACAQPWVLDVCESGPRVLVPRTALNAAEGLRADLMEPGNSLSDRAYVLLTATLAEDVPREVQGTRTRILVGVYGSGDDAGTGPSGDPDRQPGGTPPGSLADTGARLGGYALLGLLAVAVGVGLSRLRAAA